MIFSKPYRYKKFDGNLLDPQLNVRTVYFKDAYFFHYILHKKIIEILEVVFGDYPNDERFFEPVDDILEEQYKEIRWVYLRFDYEPEFQELPITSLRGFTSLRSDFVYDIKEFAKFKNDYYKENELLYKRLEQPREYRIPADLQLLFQKIAISLKEHKIKKNKLLKKTGDVVLIWHDLFFNKSKATLTYKGKAKLVSLNIHPLLLLNLLLQNQDVVFEYNQLAKELQLGSYYNTVKNMDVARHVQDVKKELTKILKELDMPEEEISKMLKTISKTGIKCLP